MIKKNQKKTGSLSGFNTIPLSADLLRPVDGTFFFLLGEQAAVFCEQKQKIYALNHTAAYIWCRLAERVKPDRISAELAKSGVKPPFASNYVVQSILTWLKLGLLRYEYPFGSEIEFPIEIHFAVDAARFNVIIRTASANLARRLCSFDSKKFLSAKTAHVLDVVEIDGLAQVFHNKFCVICCAANELAPSLRAYITEQIVAASSPNVVFHAACLVHGTKNLLISGLPGAGKTTLTLYLTTESGFKYGADDIVFIAQDGRATGVAFAPAVKPGGWDIVKEFRPDLARPPCTCDKMVGVSGSSTRNTSHQGHRIRLAGLCLSAGAWNNQAQIAG